MARWVVVLDLQSLLERKMSTVWMMHLQSFVAAEDHRACLRKLFPSVSATVVGYHKNPVETLVTLFGDLITEGKIGHNDVNVLLL